MIKYPLNVGSNFIHYYRYVWSYIWRTVEKYVHKMGKNSGFLFQVRQSKNHVKWLLFYNIKFAN